MLSSTSSFVGSCAGSSPYFHWAKPGCTRTHAARPAGELRLIDAHNPESFYIYGVVCYEKVAKNPPADMAAKRDIIEQGKAALQKGIEPLAASHPELYRVRGWSAIMPRNEETFLEDPQVKELMTTMVP